MAPEIARAGGNFWYCQLTHKCNKAWCHEILVTAPEIARGVPVDLIFICLLGILMFMSVLQSSTELAHARDI